MKVDENEKEIFDSNFYQEAEPFIDKVTNFPINVINEDILDKVKNIINGDRLDCYGPPKESFQRIADYWNVYLSHKKDNIITAKLLGVISGMILIPLLFYSYQVLFQKDCFIIDISIFVISVIISYVISYRIMKKDSYSFEIISIFILLLITIAFFIFTFNPPECFIFLDPITGSYGIPSKV